MYIHTHVQQIIRVLALVINISIYTTSVMELKHNCNFEMRFNLSNNHFTVDGITSIEFYTSLNELIFNKNIFGYKFFYFFCEE